ncbi:hypothetical protein [Myroides pelagicus]|uniref:Uncharacterized protein n=1 Tax=Myroides pelagicus TaxID=270914 RepID=A0A7K1GPF2_9FLAO|nr:hypothetical protein [Myroides pelagicus]MEC4113379.1 hypothetical protein [Myroides pelagicus]MTH30283.1 hypothetical protein [Myroides pelagicus]
MDDLLLSSEVIGYVIAYVTLIVLFSIRILKSKHIVLDDKYLVVLLAVALLPIGVIYGIYLRYFESNQAKLRKN